MTPLFNIASLSIGGIAETHAHRAWLKYMEFLVKTLFSPKKNKEPRFKYESMQPMDLATKQTEMIEARCKELSEMRSK